MEAGPPRPRADRGQGLARRGYPQDLPLERVLDRVSGPRHLEGPLGRREACLDPLPVLEPVPTLLDEEAHREAQVRGVLGSRFVVAEVEAAVRPQEEITHVLL